MRKIELWAQIPGVAEETPAILPFVPEVKQSDAAVVIFPGGGYAFRASDHEGDQYALFLNQAGITAFVVDYRVAPHRFPAPLLDARRAVRWVRAHAAEYGLDVQKIAVMGSSAGGHLAALSCTYKGEEPIETPDAIDGQNGIPNAQILCYPVICSPTEDKIAHMGSYENLLGENAALYDVVDPTKNVTEETPPAFLWHTADDLVVNVINTYRYATVLREHNIPTEVHVFPHGRHGLGLLDEVPHTAIWGECLLRWFRFIGWL